jgi:GntR family transcriptional regulator, transcriptional repressor for pyruvate dehydrogenase complex
MARPVALATLARRPKALGDEIVASLSKSIKSGELKVGDKLPTESEIMARFDVSRTVVREALSKLQAAQSVETRHGIGSFVIKPPAPGNFKIASRDLSTVADVISVLELRISLETEAAGLAAQRRNETNLTSMRSALKAFEVAIQQDRDGVPSDFQFHMEVARATGNQHFADLMTYLGTMIIPRARMNTLQHAPEGKRAYLQRVHTEHESIFVAIQHQDTEAARAAMRTHLANSRERLRNASETLTAAVPP